MRHESRRRNVEQDFCLGAPVREHAEPSIGLVVLVCHDTLGDLALKHQHHRVVPGRPGFDRQPIDQECGRDIVRQVGDDFCAAGSEPWTWVEMLRIGTDDLQPSRISRGNFLERWQGAFVAFDGDHVARARCQQRTR